MKRLINGPIGQPYFLQYENKKKRWKFTIWIPDVSKVIVDGLFAQWKRDTYLWTPENFGMFLRDRGMTKYWIEKVFYRNLKS